jgi:hypothetical protein
MVSDSQLKSHGSGQAVDDSISWNRWASITSPRPIILREVISLNISLES